MSKAIDFLKAHKMTADSINMKEVVNSFLIEMEKGLAGEESSLLMLPTYIEADGEVKANEPVVAVDAGGTNFRAAKVYFDDNLKLITENIQKGKMPGVEEELSKEAFFNTLATYLKDYKSVSDKIGFCFSYAAEIFPSKDGKLLEWSKEIKAPEVIGQMVGHELLAAMGTPEKQIVLMNDTVSTLLAGKAARAVKSYDTYIGYILGTGTNTAYIEANKKITKTDGLDMDGNQIINIESGAFAKMPRTDIDLAFDNTTKNPGRYAFEKMFAGGYFGGLCTTALKTAAKEGVFADPEIFENLEELSTEQVNKYVYGIDDAKSVLPGVFTDQSDKLLAAEIIDGLIDRAAKLVAANLAAVILKSGKAKTHEKPVLMTIEGTTFYKLHGFRSQFEKYLKNFLSGENQRFYEIVEVENSSLLGAAIAAIVN
ncbi:MAG TPA: hypothetical protein PK335_00735 [Draconibacterium sp.]|nr:hypothetical protein [Draconibacterium sp.]